MNIANVCIRGIDYFINGICYFFNRLVECCKGKPKAKATVQLDIKVVKLSDRDLNTSLVGEKDKMEREVHVENVIDENVQAIDEAQKDKNLRVTQLRRKLSELLELSKLNVSIEATYKVLEKKLNKLDERLAPAPDDEEGKTKLEFSFSKFEAEIKKIIEAEALMEDWRVRLENDKQEYFTLSLYLTEEESYRYLGRLGEIDEYLLYSEEGLKCERWKRTACMSVSSAFKKIDDLKNKDEYVKSTHRRR